MEAATVKERLCCDEAAKLLRRDMRAPYQL